VPGGVNVLPGDIINVCGQVFDYIGFFPVVPHTIWADGLDDFDNAARLAAAINADGANGCTATYPGAPSKTVTITNGVAGIQPHTVVYSPIGANFAPTITQTVFGQDGMNNCAAALNNYDVCVLIGIDGDASHQNLVNAVNGVGTGYVYTPGFGPHTTVSASGPNLLTNQSLWTVDAVGAGGNTFEGTEISPGAWQSANPSKYTGGVDATGFSTNFDYFRGHDGSIDELFGGPGTNGYFSCDPTGLRDPQTNALLGYVNQDQAYYDTVAVPAPIDSTWGISVYVAGVTPDNHFPSAIPFAATFPTLFPCMDAYGLP
jgi:hypothetical protein